MTERFLYELHKGCFRDNGVEMSIIDVLNTLNEQHEQIQILNASNGEMEDYLARLEEENEQLRKKIERITKEKENWVFIADCSVQVMNEEEKFKEDYLKIALEKNNELVNENEQLYELIYFANTLIAFKTSESCQNEWEKRLKEL